MCSKIVNGVETVWDCGFPKPVVCGWRCEVCGKEAGGPIRHYFDGHQIRSTVARDLMAMGGPTEYFDRHGNPVQPKGWNS